MHYSVFRQEAQSPAMEAEPSALRIVLSIIPGLPFQAHTISYLKPDSLPHVVSPVLTIQLLCSKQLSPGPGKVVESKEERFSVQELVQFPRVFPQCGLQREGRELGTWSNDVGP